MMEFSLKKSSPSVIGMVHVGALPGTPRSQHSLNEIIETCVQEALIYEKEEFDAIILENMHDTPYLKGSVGPEIIACMTSVACAVRDAVKIPIGIQILAGANKEALAVAQAASLQFIRAEGFVFGHLADEGYFESCAGELLRFRKKIGAEEIKIWVDIKKKHSSHAITADVSLVETAKAAHFFMADALIVTGTATGEVAAIEDLKDVSQQCDLPVVVGSGMTADNLVDYWPWAAAFIVGSSLKEKGYWANTVSKERVAQFMNRVRELRQQGR